MSCMADRLNVKFDALNTICYYGVYIYVIACLCVLSNILCVARFARQLYHTGIAITPKADDMMMDTLKRWLNKLFVWWPWRRTARVRSTGSVTTDSASSVQEPLWLMVGEVHNPDESLSPLQDISSVALEQGSAETHPSPLTTSDLSSTAMRPDTRSLSSTEAHLAFLRYLVAHGIVNEGFAYNHVPEQYRRLH